jgi:hypothetical protein
MGKRDANLPFHRAQTDLRQDIADYLARYIGEPKIAPLRAEGQLFVVNTQDRKHRRVGIV